MTIEPTRRLWAESWYGDFAAPDGSLGGYVQLTLWPNLGRSWFWSALVGPDRRPVVLVETDAPLPVDHPGTAQRSRLERSLVSTPDGPAWTEQNHLL